MTHKGACHCGQIAFEVDGAPTQLVECNCSICSKRGSLHWFVPGDGFRLLTPEAAMATYTFNTHRIKHRFCPTCGCAPFGEGLAPSSGVYMFAVNARCLDDLDLSALPVKHFDGRTL